MLFLQPFRIFIKTIRVVRLCPNSNPYLGLPLLCQIVDYIVICVRTNLLVHATCVVVPLNWSCLVFFLSAISGPP